MKESERFFLLRPTLGYEKEMATHSSILAWRIPWTGELGGLQSTGRKESYTTERLHFHFHTKVTSSSRAFSSISRPLKSLTKKKDKNRK